MAFDTTNNYKGINWGSNLFTEPMNNTGSLGGLDFSLNPNISSTPTFGEVNFNQGSGVDYLANLSPFGQQQSPSMLGGLLGNLNMGNISTGLNIVKGLGQLYFAQQAMDQQKKTNKMNRKAVNRNLKNQSRVTNMAIQRRAISDASGQGLEGDAQREYVNNYMNRFGNDGSKL